MKLGPCQLNNTERDILSLLARGMGLNVPQLVRMKYNYSHQWEKKERTYGAHMRRMEKLGYIRSVGVAGSVPVWIITDQGRDAVPKPVVPTITLRLVEAKESP